MSHIGSYNNVVMYITIHAYKFPVLVARFNEDNIILNIKDFSIINGYMSQDKLESTIKWMNIYYYEILANIKRLEEGKFTYLIKNTKNMDCYDITFNSHNIIFKNKYGKYLKNIDKTDWRELTPLFRAVIAKNYNLVKFFINNGANLDIHHRFYKTPLYYALSQNDLKMVSLLGIAGAKLPENNEIIVSQKKYLPYFRMQNKIDKLNKFVKRFFKV